MEQISLYDVKARKPHQCFHCYRTITPGTVYSRFVGKDGGIYVFPSHIDCNQAAWAYIGDCGPEYFEDGSPPLYDEFSDSGEFSMLCNAYRGFYPHAITRLELTRQLGRHSSTR